MRLPCTTPHPTCPTLAVHLPNSSSSHPIRAGHPSCAVIVHVFNLCTGNHFSTTNARLRPRAPSCFARDLITYMCSPALHTAGFTHGLLRKLASARQNEIPTPWTTVSIGSPRVPCIVQFRVLTRPQACDDVHAPCYCWSAEEPSGEDLTQIIRGTGRSRRTSITSFSSSFLSFPFQNPGLIL